MNLNALTNLTKTADTPHRVPDKAKADSGFATVFQEADTAQSSKSAPQTGPDSAQAKGQDSPDSNGSPDQERAKSSASQDGEQVHGADGAPPETVLAPLSSEEKQPREAGFGTPKEKLPKGEVRTTLENTVSALQGRDDIQEPAITASDSPNAAPSKTAQGRDTTLPTPELEKTSDPKSVLSATQGSEQRVLGQDSSGAATDIGSQAPAIRAAQNTEPQTLARSAEANAKSTLPTVESQLDGDPTTTVMSSETKGVDSRNQVGLSQTMSLLDRHLGGYPVRLLPQNASAPKGGPDVKGSGWTERTPAITMASFMAPQNVFAAASAGQQAARGLAGPANINPTQLQASLRLLAEPKTGISQGDAGQDFSWDMRTGATQITSSVTQPMAARPEMAAHVAQQIADAMKGAGNKPVEIALNPVELGRVRMVLSPSDAGLTLSILAERPDTLDLMRRNIDDLTKSFSELGYDDISFSFSQSDQMTDDGTQTSGDSDDQLIVQTDLSDLPAPAIGPNVHLAIAPDGIDMRL